MPKNKKSAKPAKSAKARAPAKKPAKKATKKPAAKKVSFIPKGMQSVSAGFAVRGCGKAVDWYTSTLGAKVKDIYRGPDGSVMHAELRFGDSIVMCGEGDDTRQYALHANFYVKDCDSVFTKAIQNGAREIRPLTNQFYGDRSGTFEDPFGNEWTIATHVEDVSPKEMARRMAAFAESPAAAA